MQKAPAACVYIVPCGGKIPGIPWVSHFPRADGIIQQKTQLALGALPEKALHIAASICVYTNDNVIVEEV